MNRDKNTESELLKSGARDFKAYQRHFMQDFFWFQVDQAPERTVKIFRELEHSYAGILDRKEVEGGIKRNTFLNIRLKFLTRKIDKLEIKAYKKENKKAKIESKLEDYKKLYYSSSKLKYKRKIDKLNKKIKSKILPDKYDILKSKASLLKIRINNNKKDGYIIETVCISKTPSSPMEYTLIDLSKILSGEKKYVSFVAEFVFHTKDCERYDTRYMRNLAENLANETAINYIDVPRWHINMKMNKDDVKWMGYLAANEMFGIPENESKDIRFSDKYKEYEN